MTTKYVQAGKTLTYLNETGSTITSNSVVVVENMLCIASTDIADDAEGELYTEGVFKVPKVSAAEITKGQLVLFDISANSGAGEFDDDQATAAAGDISGAAVAWESAGATVTEIAVKLVNPGVVESGG